MSRQCPYYGRAISQQCLECETKLCKQPGYYKPKAKYRYKHISIGIDQSYKCTGISISADGELIKVKSVDLRKYNNNSERRRALADVLSALLRAISGKAYPTHYTCTIERIRQFSQNYINIDYIKAMGALDGIIIDVMAEHNIPVYSVDTRCWKSQVVGTSKPMANNYSVPEEKWPTVLWCIRQGFKEAILEDWSDNRRKAGLFIDREGKRCHYNDDAADSAAISMFWFNGDHSKLQEEH